MPVKLFVGNLSFRTTEQQLREMFDPYGEVLSAKLITERDTGQSRGFGFVEMADEDGAQAAIQALNGSQLEGRRLGVEIAKPKDAPRRVDSGYSGSGGRGRW